MTMPENSKFPPGFILPPFAGIEPFPFVARRPGQRFRRLFVAVHFRFRNQLRVAAIKCAENFTAISDEKKAFIFFFVRRLLADDFLPVRPGVAASARRHTR